MPRAQYKDYNIRTDYIYWPRR